MIPILACNGVIPSEIAEVIAKIINLLKIAVPVILIIFGMLDFAKGLIAQKEDEIKKGQKAFITRLISGVFVFLVISIVQLVVNLLQAGTGAGDTWSCVQSIIGGNAARGE